MELGSYPLLQKACIACGSASWARNSRGRVIGSQAVETDRPSAYSGPFGPEQSKPPFGRALGRNALLAGNFAIIGPNERLGSHLPPLVEQCVDDELTHATFMGIRICLTDVPNRLEGHWPPRKWSHPEWLRDSGPLHRSDKCPPQAGILFSRT